MRLPVCTFFTALVLLLSFPCQSQDSLLQKLSNFPGQFFSSVNKKVESINRRLEKQAEKMLRKMERQEEKIYRRLMKKDSLLARRLFRQTEGRPGDLLKDSSLLLAENSGAYQPWMDTLNSSLRFLEQNQARLPKAAQLKNLESIRKLKDLKSQFARTEKIKQYLKERRAMLKEKLTGHPAFKKYMQKLNKHYYYYTKTIEEARATLADPKKLEQKAIALLHKIPAFQKFLQQHSELAGLFRVPGNYSDPQASLAGLQTRTQVASLIRSRFGSGPDAMQQLQQNVQQARSQLDALKDKINQAGGSSSDFEMPDFKPNGQKTKSFLQRIEWGSNLQTTRAQYYFPTTTDLALSLGYKLNDKSIIGIGASYKMGLGTGWRNMKISHQGAGLRSFLDWKLKGKFYLSSGFEMNYRAEFSRIRQLQNYTAWQQSALAGLSKRFAFGKKWKSEVKILYDFFYRRNYPAGQPILFRMGYVRG